MTGIERNGVSGLALRATLIALVAIVFGCASKAPTVHADQPATQSPAYQSIAAGPTQ